MHNKKAANFHSRLFILLQIRVEQISKIILADKTHQLLQNIPIRIQQIKLGLVHKTERALERLGIGVVGIKKTKLDLAIILCFEPMNHGRHGAADTSGKAEEFHQL